MATTSKQAAAEEPEFDPTLDSVQRNYARLMSHVIQVSNAGAQQTVRAQWLLQQVAESTSTTIAASGGTFCTPV